MKLISSFMGHKQENAELLDKIAAGLKLAIRRLYEQKAANNETAIISVNGEIKTVSAKELLKKHKH
jgi:hypothetical protein